LLLKRNGSKTQPYVVKNNLFWKWF